MKRWDDWINNSTKALGPSAVTELQIAANQGGDIRSRAQAKADLENLEFQRKRYGELQRYLRAVGETKPQY